MAIHLDTEDLINTQQMEVAMNGPNGAIHLVLRTGLVDFGSLSYVTFTFLVGPKIARRQFIGAIASGALSTVQGYDKTIVRDNENVKLGANLILIDADYDEESGRVKVRAEIASSMAITKLAISYNISILAEPPGF